MVDGDEAINKAIESIVSFCFQEGHTKKKALTFRPEPFYLSFLR
jgi:hypothetical protein